MVQVHRTAAIAAAQRLTLGTVARQIDGPKAAHQHFGIVMLGVAMGRDRIGKTAGAYQFHVCEYVSSGQCARRARGAGPQTVHRQ